MTRGKIWFEKEILGFKDRDKHKTYCLLVSILQWLPTCIIVITCSRVLCLSQNFEFYKGEWLASCHKREEKTDTVRYYTLYNMYDM